MALVSSGLKSLSGIFAKKRGNAEIIYQKIIVHIVEFRVQDCFHVLICASGHVGHVERLANITFFFEQGSSFTSRVGLSTDTIFSFSF